VGVAEIDVSQSGEWDREYGRIGAHFAGVCEPTEDAGSIGAKCRQRRTENDRVVLHPLGEPVDEQVVASVHVPLQHSAGDRLPKQPELVSSPNRLAFGRVTAEAGIHAELIRERGAADSIRRHPVRQLDRRLDHSPGQGTGAAFNVLVDPLADGLVIETARVLARMSGAQVADAFRLLGQHRQDIGHLGCTFSLPHSATLEHDRAAPQLLWRRGHPILELKTKLIGESCDMPMARCDQLPAVLGDDAFRKAVGTPAPPADALRRLVKLNTDARALQHLGAPKPGKSGADHQDARLIAHRAHPGQAHRFSSG
jgi:hypothetical protein